MANTKSIERSGSPNFGAFVISLDFELHWGVRAHSGANGRYRQNLLGARVAIPKILDLFAEFEIAATWAVVGFLFARSRNELQHFSPTLRPHYNDPRLDPYSETIGENEEQDPLHYAPSIIELIRRRSRQEIGTHTFSHYCSLEPGHTRESFSADLQSAVTIAASRGIRIRSLVYPRDQINPEYTDVLLNAGITSFRGSARGGMNRPLARADQGIARQAARMLDHNVNLSGQQITRWHEVLQPEGICNIRSSRFLMPWTPRNSSLASLRFNRINNSLLAAAQSRGIFHLWWHPHNFGRWTKENLDFLRKILESFAWCRREYGMESLNIAEAADVACGKDSTAVQTAPRSHASVPAVGFEPWGFPRSPVGCPWTDLSGTIAESAERLLPSDVRPGDQKDRIKIAHVISNLAPGGAERMLYELICSMDSQRFENEVISLTNLGEIGLRLQAWGINVRTLTMSKGFPSAIAVFRLVRYLRQSRPALVQTWMYHADLLGGIAARYAGRLPVVWGIHHNNLDRRMNKMRTVWVARACGRLSNILAESIVCCSSSALKLHATLGYSPDKLRFLPNGFNVDKFRPDFSARLAVRRELGLSPDAFLIGMAARYHPLKDIPNFVAAAARLNANFPDVNFVLCGRGLAADNRELFSALDGIGLLPRCHLLGIRYDMPRLFASFDLATSSSVSEAFPLGVGEAMSCGTPCVVTDAGDSAMLVGETGRVVPVRDPAALASAWAELIISNGERQRLSIAARLRIEGFFDVSSVAKRYQDLYEQILHPPPRRTSPSISLELEDACPPESPSDAIWPQRGTADRFM